MAFEEKVAAVRLNNLTAAERSADSRESPEIQTLGAKVSLTGENMFTQIVYCMLLLRRAYTTGDLLHSTASALGIWASPLGGARDGEGKVVISCWIAYLYRFPFHLVLRYCFEYEILVILKDPLLSSHLRGYQPLLRQHSSASYCQHMFAGKGVPLWNSTCALPLGVSIRKCIRK